MLKATCTLSGLHTRNTVVQEATRNLPDHLNATIPGQGVSRLCPPMDLITNMLEAERRQMRADWSKVGRVMLGQWSEDTIQSTKAIYRGDHYMPPGLYAEGVKDPESRAPT
eukprot:4336509-Pyramimonas_sp.AAC.1